MSQQDTEELSGGTLRASVRSPQDMQDMQVTPEPYRVHNGVIRSDGGGQLAQSNGQYAPASGSILATARSNLGPTGLRSGSDVSVELEPGNPASRTSLAVALRLGLIKEPYPGIYEDAQGGTPQGPQGSTQPRSGDPAPQPEKPAQAGPELADEKAEGDWAADIEPLPQQAYDSALAFAADAVAGEGVEGWDKMAQVLARDAGLAPEAASQFVSAGYTFFEGQVSKAVQALGIGPEAKEAFYDHIRDNHPDDLKAATQALVMGRSLDGFRALAAKYLERVSR